MSAVNGHWYYHGSCGACLVFDKMRLMCLLVLVAVIPTAVDCSSSIQIAGVNLF